MCKHRLVLEWRPCRTQSPISEPSRCSMSPFAERSTNTSQPPAEPSAGTRPPRRPAYRGRSPRSTSIAWPRVACSSPNIAACRVAPAPAPAVPAKLYRRAPGDVTVSLPDRRYEVPALVFAETIEQMAGQVPPDTLRGVSSPGRRGGGVRCTQAGRSTGGSQATTQGPGRGPARARLRTPRDGRRRDPVRQLPVPRPRRRAPAAGVRDEPGADRRTRRRPRRRCRSTAGSTAGDVLRGDRPARVEAQPA